MSIVFILSKEDGDGRTARGAPAWDKPQRGNFSPFSVRKGGQVKGKGSSMERQSSHFLLPKSESNRKMKGRLEENDSEECKGQAIKI